MAPEDPARRRSMLGVAAYLLVPGERRRRAAGHFGRAVIETARGVRALSIPSRSELERAASMDATAAESEEERGRHGDRQRIKID